MLEAPRDVRVDRNIIRQPGWIGTETAQKLDRILKEAGRSWDAESNGYQFHSSGSVNSPEDSGGDSETSRSSPDNVRDTRALAERMRDLAAITVLDRVLEPSAGRGRLIAKLPRQ